jgi:hypothetical protein
MICIVSLIFCQPFSYLSLLLFFWRNACKSSF